MGKSVHSWQDSKVECRGRIHILKKTDLLGCALMNALEPPFQAGYRVEVGWDSFSEYYSRELKVYIGALGIG